MKLNAGEEEYQNSASNTGKMHTLKGNESYATLDQKCAEDKIHRMQ